MLKVSKLGIRQKLLFSFLILGLFSLGSIGTFSYISARNALEEFSYNQLTSVRETKARQIESYFGQIRNQVLTMSENGMIINAMREFSGAFRTVISESGTDQGDIQRMSNAVKDYYTKEYLTRLNANLDKPKAIDSYWTGEPETVYLQYQYMVNNPNQVGEKHNLDAADDGTTYSKLHRKYHPAIRSFLEKFGYYDIFLVDSQTGHIVYTVFKEVDYTTSLSSGPYRNTNFGRVFNLANEATEKDFVYLEDFEPYDPSYSAPASFIASPIFDGDEKIGVLIFQMPIDAINAVMTGNENWRDDGLQESGETYLVGDDLTMRSISRFLVEDPDGYFSALDAAGFEPGIINKIQRMGTSIGFQKVDTEGVSRALKGETGRDIILDYRGIPVLSAFRPLQIADVDWAILSEIDVAEAFAPANRLGQMLMIAGLLLAALIAFIAFYIAGTIAKPLRLLTKGAKHLAVGDIVMKDLDRSATAKLDKRQDELGEINRAIIGLIDYLKTKAEAAKNLEAGNLNADLELASEDDILGNAIVGMRDKITLLISEMNNMSSEHDAGDIDAVIPVDEFDGAYAEMATGVNNMVKGHISVKKKAMACIKEFGQGNFDAELEQFPGKKAFINETIEMVRHHLKEVMTDVNALIHDSLEGKLNNRADASKHNGDFRVMVQGINDILDAVINPIQEAQAILEHMSKGDLSKRVTGKYKGDHAKIKDAMNTTLDSLTDILSQVAVATDQVTNGSSQVSSTSQMLSQGATEQASSLEQVSSSMIQVGSQTKQNSENASMANQLSDAARESAQLGNQQMEHMLAAMTDINNKSSEVQKIVKAIDEIAFQTNLLALNAAVEAARAGVHGKGFAVVAEEVRNLAQRSAKAAKETTDLIDGNVAAVNGGSEIAHQTANSLNEITENATKVSDLIDEIASASREQTLAVEQITEALSQIDQVTQSNTASAEESAAAAEELSGQAEQLKLMIARLNLGRGGSITQEAISGELMTLQRKISDGTNTGTTGMNSRGVQDETFINLDDAELGEF